MIIDDDELACKVLEKLELIMRRALTSEPMTVDASASITCRVIAQYIERYLKEQGYYR